MANRNPASETQRDFFAFLALAPHLVLSMRESPNGDAASVNAHGRFQLLDKTWPGSADPKNHERETLLAFSTGAAVDMSNTDEPIVHLHVDWSLIRYAWIGERKPTLIGTDKEVVLCREKDTDSRVFWFNLRHWDELPTIGQWPIESWIELTPPATKGGA